MELTKLDIQYTQVVPLSLSYCLHVMMSHCYQTKRMKPIPFDSRWDHNEIKNVRDGVRNTLKPSAAHKVQAR